MSSPPSVPPPRRSIAPKKTRYHRRRLTHRKPAITHGAVKNEINVTPLVDVVLVLLIIFMVVTPMLSRGIKVELPETIHHDKKQDTGEQILVSISSEGDVYVDTEKQTDGDKLVNTIRTELGKRKAEGGPRDVHVKADRRLTYGEVRKVMERIHEAGAPAVALGTEDPKKEGAK